MADHAREVTSGDRTETVRAIKQCKVMLLLCSDAALQSNAVKQDLQLAWSHERPYLPLLIERIDFAEQAEYWLEGSRWIEAMNSPPDQLLLSNQCRLILQPRLKRLIQKHGDHHPTRNH
jgi:hypothetical protein